MKRNRFISIGTPKTLQRSGFNWRMVASLIATLATINCASTHSNYERGEATKETFDTVSGTTLVAWAVAGMLLWKRR